MRGTGTCDQRAEDFCSGPDWKKDGYDKAKLSKEKKEFDAAQEGGEAHHATNEGTPSQASSSDSEEKCPPTLRPTCMADSRNPGSTSLATTTRS